MAIGCFGFISLGADHQRRNELPLFLRAPQVPTLRYTTRKIARSQHDVFGVHHKLTKMQMRRPTS